MSYKKIYVTGLSCPKCKEKVKNALLELGFLKEVSYEEDFIRASCEGAADDAIIKKTIEDLGTYWVDKIEEEEHD